MPFSTKLRHLREQSGLSQAKLADKTGLSTRSIQNWEQGHRKPRADAILALATALHVAPDLLLRELQEKGPKKKGRSRKGKLSGGPPGHATSSR
jgi:transcriptional regulator with XRE-family HTH domain